MSDLMLSIGLLTDTSTQLTALTAVIESLGYCVGSCLIISEFDEKLETDEKNNIDAWVVCVDSENDQAELIDDWLENLIQPVIFCDSQIPKEHDDEYNAWVRRLTKKLMLLSGSINLARTKEGSAKEIWVLAASTGGPGAVKKFIAALPPKLDIGFVYVQHIDKGFDGTLAKAMNGSSHYPAVLIAHGDVIKKNELSIVPPDKATEVMANGTFVVKNHPWSAPYSPSVDSIVADVAYHFGKNSGVVVFTGMGNDGAIGGKIMCRHGGKVWVQTPNSCTSSSMPEAVIDTGGVDLIGTPEELAAAFVKLAKDRAYLIKHHYYIEEYKRKAKENISN